MTPGKDAWNGGPSERRPAVGVVRVTEAALPLLRRSANPVVVTVSSSAGPAEESARVVVRPATLGPDGPTGTFQDESGVVPW
ncbi:hypothetical protein ABZ901_22230 [Actinacidiphila alni]|uniref:hypothetical protein n=1 Tax=Actinacidiphila alni TaxID=380248 RepID=UPI0033CC85A5